MQRIILDTNMDTALLWCMLHTVFQYIPQCFHAPFRIQGHAERLITMKCTGLLLQLHHDMQGLQTFLYKLIHHDPLRVKLQNTRINAGQLQQRGNKPLNAFQLLTQSIHKLVMLCLGQRLILKQLITIMEVSGVFN